MKNEFPNLAAETGRRGIKKSTMAKALGISSRTFYNKWTGTAPFTWPEVCKICEEFFPDKEPAYLFAREDRTA